MLMLILILFMTQQSDRRETQTLHNPTQAARRSLKDMIELVQQKKQYYKKAISQIQPDPAQASLRYLFNCNNTIQGITPQQQQFIEEENIARGSIAEKEEEQKVQSRRRLRLNRDKYKSMKKRSPHIEAVPSLERYKTQPNESKSKELKRSILCSPFNPLPNIAKQQNHSKLRIAIAEMKRSGKNTEKVERLYSLLAVFNPFMMKIGKIIGVCLLRIGHIEEFLNDSVIYDTNTECNKFYIILQGEARLRGKEGMKKTYQTGESLLQQLLFMEELKFPLQKAKVAKKTILLQIDKCDFTKLNQQLYKFGYKQGAQELSSLLRRNFIAKNWVREKSRQAYNS